MKNLTLMLLTLLLSTGLPLGAHAQDGDADLYEAGRAWANLVMVDNDFDAAAAQANPAVADQMTPSVIENAWAQVSAQTGALRSLEPKAQTMLQGYHVVVFAAQFDVGSLDVRVVMADDHTVAGFSVSPSS